MFGRILTLLRELRSFSKEPKSAYAFRLKPKLGFDEPMIAVGPIRNFPNCSVQLFTSGSRGYILLTQEQFDQAQAQLEKYLEDTHK